MKFYAIYGSGLMHIINYLYLYNPKGIMILQNSDDSSPSPNV